MIKKLETVDGNIIVKICDDEDDPLRGNMKIEFKCFTWETWDSSGYNVKISGRYWGDPYAH